MRAERSKVQTRASREDPRHWYVTLDHVPPALLPEIARSDAQREAWARLFHIDRISGSTSGYTAPLTEAFLRRNPGLMLDTRLFDDAFVDRLFLAVPDLPTRCDGLLIHADNQHALGLLTEDLAGQVDLIYIDPPYNTGGKEFAYRDGYSHADWLALMQDRLAAALPMLDEAGTLLISCDDSEVHHLRMLMERDFAALPFLATLVWKSRQNVDSRPLDNISNDHEYVLVYGGALRGADKDRSKYRNPDGDPRGDWMSDNMVGLAPQAARPNLHFHIRVAKVAAIEAQDGAYAVKAGDRHYDIADDRVVGAIPSPGELCFLCTSKDEKTVQSFGHVATPVDGRTVHEELYPCTDRGWRYHPRTLATMIVDNRVLWPRRSGGRPRHKKFFADLKSKYTSFSSHVGYTSDGTRDLTTVMGADVPFNFPKPVSLLTTLVEQGSRPNGLVLDYFAGSGTTAAGVLAQNRRDGGSRQYVLVESGTTFETVLVPRVLRSIYSDRWQEGLPDHGRGVSQVVEVLSLADSTGGNVP